MVTAPGLPISATETPPAWASPSHCLCSSVLFFLSPERLGGAMPSLIMRRTFVSSSTICVSEVNWTASLMAAKT